jgi:hypothetical protein
MRISPSDDIVESKGLEPSVPCVQGRCISQLCYDPMSPALPCALYFGSDCSVDEFESSRLGFLNCCDNWIRTSDFPLLRGHANHLRHVASTRSLLYVLSIGSRNFNTIGTYINLPIDNVLMVGLEPTNFGF